MRSEGEIRQQLKQVRFRHLKQQLKDNYKRQPGRCAFNQEVAIPGGSDTIRLCSVFENTLCDERFGQGDRARSCSSFKPLRTKEEVREAFLEVVESSDRGLVAYEYPDIAALMWVLDESRTSMPEDLSEVEAPREDASQEGPPQTPPDESRSIAFPSVVGLYPYRWIYLREQTKRVCESMARWLGGVSLFKRWSRRV